MTEEPVKARQLGQNDIPALMALVMDRMGLTHFHFSPEELASIRGRVALDHNKDGTGYTMKRYI